MAVSHGARADVRILCERIIVGQRDEIATIADLAVRPRPARSRRKVDRHKMVMPNGMEHDMLMPACVR